MMNLIAFKAIQWALCNFLKICIEHDDCPDGVCDEALLAIDGVEDDSPPVKAASGNVQSVGAIDWSYMPAFADAVVALIAAAKGLFGLNRVG